jgi:hypothetical protein
MHGMHGWQGLQGWLGVVVSGVIGGGVGNEHSGFSAPLAQQKKFLWPFSQQYGKVLSGAFGRPLSMQRFGGGVAKVNLSV